jgi:hypothetical protein
MEPMKGTFQEILNQLQKVDHEGNVVIPVSRRVNYQLIETKEGLRWIAARRKQRILNEINRDNDN